MKSYRHISFANFRLDTGNELLLQGSRKISLRPKTFAFLNHLVKHPGRLVTKEELLHELWPRCTVCDDALAHSIAEIRKALGDDAKAPRFIETVHRRGYRFIGKVGEHRKPNIERTRNRQRSNLKAGFKNAQCVGREFELVQLQSCLDEALAGRRQVFFVTGEQGVGKTTLVDSFLATLQEKFPASSRRSNPESAKSDHRSGALLGRGQCIDFHGSCEAYMPVLEALTQLCQKSGRKSSFVAALRRHAPLWLMQIPILADAAERNLKLSTLRVPRERMLREIAEALEAFSAENPLILLLEDLHWSDYSTIDMISYLARRRAPARLMLICTYRPAEVLVTDHPLKAVKQELQTHQLCIERQLALFDEATIGKYLASRFPMHDFPVELRRWIHRRTEGNPLFIVNLVDHLLAQGIIVSQNGHSTLSVEIEKLNMEVPATIQQMIEQQIVEHSEGEQRILEAGSVEGVEFSAAGVALALDTEESLIEATCEKLARQTQLLRSDSTRQLTNGQLTSCYRFTHALYRYVCYQRLLETRRIKLHQRIGEYTELACENHNGEAAANLAMHFEQGREYARAVKYYEQAAENANQRYAAHEAAELARKGLSLLDVTPDVPDRARRELGLLIALGSALMWTQGFGASEVKEAFTRARNLCVQCGDYSELVLPLFGLWLCCNVRAEVDTARQLTEQLLQLGQTQENPFLLSEIHYLAGVTYRNRGELTLALKHLEQGIACRSPQKEDAYRLPDGKNSAIACLSFIALVKWRLGYPDQAMEKADEALALAQKTGRPEDSIFSWLAVARLHRALRNSKKALELAETSIAAARQHEWIQLVSDGACVYGWALAAEGRVNEGIDYLRQALVAQQEIRSSHLRAEMLATLAEVLKNADQTEEGLALVEQALEMARSKGMRHLEPEILLLKGNLLIRSSESEQRAVEAGNSQSTICNNLSNDIEAPLHQAIEIARQQKAKAIELRATMSLARLWQKQNRQVEARQQLLRIYRWFTEGCDTPDLQDAGTLLQQLSQKTRVW